MQGKKSGESQGIFQKQESQGKVMDFRSAKFIFSQSEHPNFETFSGGACPRPS